jgi:hypothetical protein
VKKQIYFSRFQLRQLRADFGRVTKVNPDGAMFNAFRRFVNALPEPQRAQLAANNIPWVSRIARGSMV